MNYICGPDGTPGVVMVVLVKLGLGTVEVHHVGYIKIQLKLQNCWRCWYHPATLHNPIIDLSFRTIRFVIKHFFFKWTFMQMESLLGIN